MDGENWEVEWVMPTYPTSRHLWTTLMDHTWGPHLGDHTWGPNLGGGTNVWWNKFGGTHFWGPIFLGTNFFVGPNLGDHIFGDKFWGTKFLLDQHFGRPILKDQFWETNFGRPILWEQIVGDHTWGPRLGTTLGDHTWGPHLDGLVSKVMHFVHNKVLFDVMVYPLTSQRTSWCTLWYISILVMTYFVDLINKQYSLREGK